MITLDIPERDYELSVITRLIEQEGARILGVTVEPPAGEGDPYRVHIQLDLLDSSRVTSTLRRFGYAVVFADNETENEAEWNRKAESFLRYLDM
jgi:acetoin utilization protein AcuB